MLARRVTLALVITVMAMVVAACADESSDPGPAVSTLAPLTVPSSTTLPEPDGSVPTTGIDPPIPERITPTEVLRTLTVEQAGACSQGRGTILVTHDPGASSILRQITAIVDGTQASTTFTGSADRFEIPGVSCDGAIRTVLVATIDLDGGTQSRAFAVRMTP